MREIFTAEELDYLRSQHLGRMATVQPNGTLQVSPVGFRVAAATGTIDIHGYRMAASRKFRNVQDNGRVAFVVDDVPSTDPWRVRCIEIRGTAETIGSGDDALIRIHPRRIISFGIGEGIDEVLPPHELKPSIRNVQTTAE
ncbi:MAG TPA: PPOX class F420-dependent oxidoreductase [Flexivirga sp.]|uniref:PPOX class F420-dependent oxidoreductase n=1 Tax=Flexivirga sp. TaxID=1962927 RepID=UPI002BCCF7CF|nr:PPOX class F420-dependent oxidoreductase [Flexivirga sp.]HWC21572.1 PPOX class F420-dependent oxidoreductase [Flexivirga sp.]